MRFAYLSCDFGVPVFGPLGASVHLREMVGALHGLGHEVEVFSPNLGLGAAVPAPGGFRQLPLDGCAARAASLLSSEDTGRSDHLVREWRRLVYAEQVQRTLLPILERWRPDAIYERYSLFAYAGVELAERLGVPLLLEVNAPLTLEAAKYRELVLRRTAEELERLVFERAAALFVVSRELEMHARRLGVPGEGIHVLPNGVDAERFHPDVSGGAVRERHALHGKRVIGFVGSLKPWHDLDTLLEAARRLAQRDPRIRLLVVGEGPRLAELRAAREPHVICTGAVPHDDVPAHLAAADVVVVPYGKGGDAYFSPLKLFEAMAAAKPVVGARIGQVAEVLVHGESGLLYEPGEPADLAERIREILDAPGRGAELAAAARRAIVPGRTWRDNARRIVEIARDLRRGTGAATP
jgi:glycosyltransferase involved in cell wall biosynthesis